MGPNGYFMDIENLNPEFLDELTKKTAYFIHLDTREESHICWSKAEKNVALIVLDAIKNNCLKNKDCIIKNGEYDQYLNLDKINIQELKEIKAYFMWMYNGSEEETSDIIMKSDYFNACDDLIIKCSNKQFRNNCPYYKLLNEIDRRKKERRTLNVKQSKKTDNFIKRNKTNRRKNNERHLAFKSN